MEFSAFTLRPEVAQAIKAKGFTTATPIQAAAIPLALEGKDVLGQARTGTGKTLAFGIPIAHRLDAARERGRAPRAFVLTPTRELALQVAKELEWLAPHLTITPIYGGTGYGKQAEALRRGSDVVVATPGRAIDYLEQGVLDLSRVEMVVLDEADEMLSMGFEEAVEQLLEATPPTRQTLLFSATLPTWARRLSERYQKAAIHINVIKDEAISYEEVAIQAPLHNRLSVLSDLLFAYAPERAIVFTSTKAECNDLALGLESRAHSAAPIHGDMSQIDRERVMERFRSGAVSVLVATDVAARGLDIPEVDLVVHYRLPDQNESYLHRSGRTGRAGRSGKVVILYGPREKRELETLERELKRNFKRVNPPTPEEVMAAKWAGLARRIARQPEADKKLWREQAERLIAEGGVDAVAGMLALILGGAPTPKSLLTGEENWVTVKLSGSRISVNRAVAVLKGAGAGEIGRIRLDGDVAAYVDIRPEDLGKLDHTALRDLRLTRATEVPAEARPSERQAQGFVRAQGKRQGQGHREGSGQRRGQGGRLFEGPAEDRREGERRRVVYR
ncbi:DEAD/DEAH box helicase [Meiothermus taiwanensis]|jgi:ATP-dependent RNA helicase DeaD|uniref:DEAD-box ATP-dependent RNA helicase CshA n=2 Tax=Meiothermus taiwanensis TaxID=172827 RepID=A0A399E6N7_9DEIN|nr:DEAD/DEAH box helicase [Meiothermus taiwanensis]AWR85525.1 ATP-dependent RNA helicase DeaD [Meiothermus taiwanensis WR-220]KIQ53497.1 DEAD/DEAH box helicase [Meiothermus taiwanensis]RIH80125.1 DEAD-box ATP-dependent RNA helicase CshA [Meiothermus taiwanensis]